MLLSRCVSPSDLILDVGNDTAIPWEFSENRSFTGPARTSDFSAKLNQILSSNCECSGCSKQGPYCAIPLRFYSDYAGVMDVSEIRVYYKSVNVLYNVTYGRPFKLSEGCTWRIQHQGGIYIASIPPSYAGPNSCQYTAASYGPSGGEDALIDAVYRLLNQTLDTDPTDGVVDINIDQKISFGTHGKIGVQSLWGPAILKIVVWI
jgi:hypothetical protein